MKNFLLLLFALLILVVFGGSAYFLSDVSKGARFERLDQDGGDSKQPSMTTGSSGSPSSSDDKK